MKFRSVELLLLLLVLSGAGGCANEQPMRDFQAGKEKLSAGQVEPGLALIEQASKGDPENVEYRQYLFNQREKIVNQLLAKAELERNNQAFDDTIADYRRVLGIDANNQRAMDGIDGVQHDRQRKDQLLEATALFDKGDEEGARTRLRRIIAEDPDLREARALQKRIDEKDAEHRAASSPVIKSAIQKTISLEFKDATLKSVFDVISRMSGLNFAFDKDIKPDLKATIFVKDTTIENAINLLLVTNQLRQQILDNNTIIIYPDTPAKVRDYQQQEVKSFYLANADVKKTLEMIKTILNVKDVFIDESKNMLVLRDTPEVVRLAGKLIASEDFPNPEVELKVEILEINTSHLTNLGLQFPEQVSAGVGTSGSFTLNQWLNRNSNFVNLNVTDPAFALNLQNTDTDVTLLANPRIRVTNREKASIQIGQRLPVLTTVSTAGVGSSQSVNYIDVGLKLDVEPSIRLDDEVDMKVKLEVSSVNQTITLSDGTQVYQLGTRNADTVLRLKDGDTQILAGLIQDNDSSTVNKIPGVGDVPLIGRLFSNDNKNKQKTDLVLLITPHIVRDVTRPDEVSSQFPSGTDSNIGSVLRSSSPMFPVKIAITPTGPERPAVPPVPVKPAEMAPVSVMPVSSVAAVSAVAATAADAKPASAPRANADR